MTHTSGPSPSGRSPALMRLGDLAAQAVELLVSAQLDPELDLVPLALGHDPAHHDLVGLHAQRAPRPRGQRLRAPRPAAPPAPGSRRRSSAAHGSIAALWPPGGARTLFSGPSIRRLADRLHSRRDPPAAAAAADRPADGRERGPALGAVRPDRRAAHDRRAGHGGAGPAADDESPDPRDGVRRAGRARTGSGRRSRRLDHVDPAGAQCWRRGASCASPRSPGRSPRCRPRTAARSSPVSTSWNGFWAACKAPRTSSAQAAVLSGAVASEPTTSTPARRSCPSTQPTTRRRAPRTARRMRSVRS